MENKIWSLAINEAIHRLGQMDCKGVQVFNRRDLEFLFADSTQRTLKTLLRNLVEQRILQRVARGIYVNCLACSRKIYLIEEIACVLRRGHFNYVSLESILSEFGVISQIMVSRITVMTTGASGVFDTPYGTIEFTHTNRSLESLRARTVYMDGRPLFIATKEAGVADLKRVGRNVNMIDFEELDSDNVCR
jgi:hypothetical protein